MTYLRARRIPVVVALRVVLAVACGASPLLIPVPDPEASVFLRHGFPVLSLLIAPIMLQDPFVDFLGRQGGRIRLARPTAVLGAEAVIALTWFVAARDEGDFWRITAVYALGLGLVYGAATVTMAASWVLALGVGAISLIPGRVSAPMTGHPTFWITAIVVALVGLALFLVRGSPREALPTR